VRIRLERSNSSILSTTITNYPSHADCFELTFGMNDEGNAPLGLFVRESVYLNYFGEEKPCVVIIQAEYRSQAHRMAREQGEVFEFGKTRVQGFVNASALFETLTSFQARGETFTLGFFTPKG